ncbi:efflux RND transporter periplasmic adaptor subunit [bacterium]|nr:MAG: efflux RND transporter periplasmic adaptor subunit [bacterium]
MRIAFRLFAVAALSGLLSACGHRTSERAAPPPPSVQVVTAVERDVTPVSELGGLIAPHQSVGLTSDLTESADAVLVTEGDFVHKGQVLARLDTADLEANLQAAERNYASAQAKAMQTDYQANLSIAQGGNQVTSAQAAVLQAEHTLAQDTSMLGSDEQLLEQGYIAQQQVDQQRTMARNDQQAVNSARAALASAQANAQTNGTQQQGLQAANIAAARAAAAQARAQADQIRVQIAKATIVSPIDGVIVNRNLNPGEYPGNRQIFTLQEIDHVYATLSAFAAQVVDVRQGAPVILTANALRGTPFSGQVVALLSPTQPNSSGFVVKVDVPNPDQRLRPGMAVLGRVSSPSVRGVAVPAAAFLDDNNDSVMIVQNGVTKLQHVKERASDGSYAVVTGLPAGSAVVSDGSLGLTDGQKVVLR